MSLYFADDNDQLSFGVQASNVAEVAQFSSTIDNVIIRMFTNNGVETPDNLQTGVAIGSSNFDKTSTCNNNLYFGHIDDYSNVTPVFLMQENKISINTSPQSSNSLSVAGGMYVDDISVDNSITTSSIQASNVNASNVNDIFYNISASKYINSASVSIGEIQPSGLVEFTTTFFGNSTSYTYVLSTTSNGTTTALPSQVANANVSTFSQVYASGTYTVNITVNTPGTGVGSYYTATSVASFTVGQTDNISAPSVSLSSGPSFSSTNITYVSGVPYYSSNTTVTFLSGSLGLSNIHNTIDPRTISNLKPLTVHGTTYTYTNVFTDVTVDSDTNDSNLSITLGGNFTCNLTLGAIVRNVNFQSGVVNNSLVTGIAYVGASINEGTMTVANFTGLPITSAQRLSIASNADDPLTPSSVYLADFTSANDAPSIYDAYFAPIERRFYTKPSDINRGTFAPTMPTGLSTTAQYLVIKLTTTTALSQFVINLANSNNISNVYIYWVALQEWYNAKVLYTDTANNGCAATTYQTGSTRFPVTLPQGLILSGATNIYVNINFTGYVDLDGVSVSYA